jgi:hypothetical protein
MQNKSGKESSLIGKRQQKKEVRKMNMVDVLSIQE